MMNEWNIMFTSSFLLSEGQFWRELANLTASKEAQRKEKQYVTWWWQHTPLISALREVEAGGSL